MNNNNQRAGVVEGSFVQTRMKETPWLSPARWCCLRLMGTVTSSICLSEDFPDDLLSFGQLCNLQNFPSLGQV